MMALPRRPPTEEMIVIDPSLRSFISGRTMVASQWFERMFEPMILSNASSGMPAMGPA